MNKKIIEYITNDRIREKKQIEYMNKTNQNHQNRSITQTIEFPY